MHDSSSRDLYYPNLVNATIVDSKFFNFLKVMWLYDDDSTSVKLSSGVVILQEDLLMESLSFNDSY